ncbi:MAG: hypothetical protein PHF84_00440 [bacterium]|nr:hypothetical protein [bacterium]
MLKKTIIIFFILTCLMNRGMASERPIQFNSARVAGMGNTFTAIADDKNMLFFNPAGFATYGLMETSKLDAIRDPTQWKPKYNNIGDLTVVSLNWGLNSNIIDKIGINNLLYYAHLRNEKDTESDAPLFKLIDMDFFKKFQDGTLTLEEAVFANEQFIKLYYSAIHLTMNAEVMSYARHYFGFGFFIASDAVIRVEPAGFFPNLITKFNADFIVPVGIGIPIPGYKAWSAGITLKYFTRIKAELASLDDFAAVYQFIEGDYIRGDLEDTLEKRSIMDIMLHGVDYASVPIEQLKIGTGYGFDLGVMYRPSFAWKFGLLLSDVYTKINWWDKSESSRIPINARVGAAWMPHFNLIEIIQDPILALDVEDVFHQQEKNFFLKWHFGTEAKFLFRILTLRAGINEGYPSFGVGVDSGATVLGIIGGAAIGHYSTDNDEFNINDKTVITGMIVGGAVTLFLSKFITYVPLLKFLRPNRIYFPKFNPNDREFVQKNPVCCLFSAVLAPIVYAHVQLDISYTGYELGLRPGDLMDYQTIIKLSLSYSY